MLGIIQEEGGGWELLKYSGDSRMIREGWQHCRPIAARGYNIVCGRPMQFVYIWVTVQ